MEIHDREDVTKSSLDKGKKLTILGITILFIQSFQIKAKRCFELTS